MITISDICTLRSTCDSYNLSQLIDAHFLSQQSTLRSQGRGRVVAAKLEYADAVLMILVISGSIFATRYSAVPS